MFSGIVDIGVGPDENTGNWEVLDCEKNAVPPEASEPALDGCRCPFVRDEAALGL